MKKILLGVGVLNNLKIILIIVPFLFSCALMNKKKSATVVEVAPTAPTVKPALASNNVAVSESEEEYIFRLNAFGQIAIPKCGSCLLGSSSPESIRKTEKEIFFLYGGETLNLKNMEFDYPVVLNEQVQKWINYFAKRGRHFFAQYTERSGRYTPLMSKILEEEYQLPRDFIFLAMAESGFQPHARSWAKAVGPWQFMRATGRKYGLEVDHWYIDERRDPVKATHAAGKYLRDLFEMFNSWELAAAGYNAGEGKVGRAIRKYETRNFWSLTKGRYLRSETKNYVPKIMALAIIGKNLDAFGFGDVQIQPPLDYEEIEVAPMSDLFKVSSALEMDFDDLKGFNPELTRWITPPEAPYMLKIPIGKKSLWNNVADKEGMVASDFQRYTVTEKNTSIKSIAKLFHVPAKVIAQLNKMDEHTRLHRNDVVILPFKEGQDRKEMMYADLYDKSKKGKRGKRERGEGSYWKDQLKLALKKGQLISNPSAYYTVKKGDTLWDVSKKTGVSVNTIIRSNYDLIRKRMIVPGDKLAIR